jgi:hypothetical protein
VLTAGGNGSWLAGSVTPLSLVIIGSTVSKGSKLVIADTALTLVRLDAAGISGAVYCGVIW